MSKTTEPKMRIEFSNDLPMVLVAEALAQAGITLKNNGDGTLRAEPTSELALVLQHTPSGDPS
jgi:hypothetical protein